MKLPRQMFNKVTEYSDIEDLLHCPLCQSTVVPVSEPTRLSQDHLVVRKLEVYHHGLLRGTVLSSWIRTLCTDKENLVQRQKGLIFVGSHQLNGVSVVNQKNTLPQYSCLDVARGNDFQNCKVSSSSIQWEPSTKRRVSTPTTVNPRFDPMEPRRGVPTKGVYHRTGGPGGRCRPIGTSQPRCPNLSCSGYTFVANSV